ncbi:MAG: hypothetical protein BMS9Abin05_1344 [Rhodothermia bacterium]|nr:MAG: hypothetical protein BMS9Abin05_1344 [Rhodothermia bacterium]
MRKRAKLNDDESWVELPTGIFTTDGIWFHTSEAALIEFSGDVVQKVGVGKLLAQAGSWLKSAEAAAVLSLVISLFLVSPLPAVIITLVIFVGWEAFGATFVFVPIVRLFSVLSTAAFQGVLYVLSMSWLASGDQLLAAGVGLTGFILFRWGIVRKALVPLAERLSGSLQSVPKPDRVLRSLIVRYAISMGVTLSSTESFEQRITEIWQRGKRNE